MKNFNSRKDNGSILLSFVITLPFIILIASSYISLASNSFRVSRKDQFHTYAQITADAGADYAVDKIGDDASWTGTGSEIELQNDGTTRTTYEVSVASTSDSKTITSIGRTYWPANSATSTSSSTIKVDMRPVTSGDYSVVSGVGGLVMNNNSKILGGDVFINGKISMSNSAQIGLTTSAVNVNVAHQSCPQPPSASYPRICNSGENGQPISLSNSAKIYGNVKANNQTSGTSMFNPGLTASSGVSAEPLPSYDRDAQKAAVASTITGSSAGCSSGTKSWAANLKITGNVDVTNTCKVTINGNVWITGTLSVKNSAQLIVSNSLGTTKPVIMVDGNTADFSNSALLKDNSSDTGMEIIAYKSDASCSPDCSDVTGTDLSSSQNDGRITIDNSASGPHSIFYARWTKVTVSNSGQLGALIGQTVELSNSGTITFGTSVGTGTSFWVIDGYRRSF